MAVPNHYRRPYHSHKRLDVEKLLNLADVSLVDKAGMSEVTLLLGLLLGENMPLVGMLPLDFASACESKSLFCTGLGLHFRHLNTH